MIDVYTDPTRQETLDAFITISVANVETLINKLVEKGHLRLSDTQRHGSSSAGPGCGADSHTRSGRSPIVAARSHLCRRCGAMSAGGVAVEALPEGTGHCDRVRACLRRSGWAGCRATVIATAPRTSLDRPHTRVDVLHGQRSVSSFASRLSLSALRWRSASLASCFLCVRIRRSVIRNPTTEIAAISIAAMANAFISCLTSTDSNQPSTAGRHWHGAGWGRARCHPVFQPTQLLLCPLQLLDLTLQVPDLFVAVWRV